MLLAVLSAVEIPLLAEQLLLERHIAGHGDGAHGEGFVDGTGGAHAAAGRELIVNGELGIGGVDGARQVVAVGELAGSGAGHAAACCGQEDAVAVGGGELVAADAVDLGPLTLAEAEELLELCCRGQHALAAGGDVGHVGGRLVGVSRGIVGRIDAGVDARHVAESVESAEVGSGLGADVALGPLHREAQVDEVGINVCLMGIGSELLDIAVDDARAEVEEGGIVVSGGGQQTVGAEREALGRAAGGDAHAGTHGLGIGL